MSDDRPLYDCVQVVDVLLRSFSSRLEVFPSQFAEAAGQLQLGVTQASAVRQDEFVFATVGLEVFVTKDEDEILRIEGTYLLVYRCDLDRETSEAELEQFGGGTAVFNVWPFWREAVAGAYMRMGLQLPPLPTLSPNLGVVLGKPGEDGD